MSGANYSWWSMRRSWRVSCRNAGLLLTFLPQWKSDRPLGCRPCWMCWCTRCSLSASSPWPWSWPCGCIDTANLPTATWTWARWDLNQLTWALFPLMHTEPLCPHPKLQISSNKLKKEKTDQKQQANTTCLRLRPARQQPADLSYCFYSTSWKLSTWVTTPAAADCRVNSHSPTHFGRTRKEQPGGYKWGESRLRPSV